MPCPDGIALPADETGLRGHERRDCSGTAAPKNRGCFVISYKQSNHFFQKVISFSDFFIRSHILAEDVL